MTLVLPFILHGRPGVVQRPPEGGVLPAPQRLHDAEREHRVRHDPRACPAGAGHRRWLLSALRAHTKAPYKTVI